MFSDEYFEYIVAILCMDIPVYAEPILLIYFLVLYEEPELISFTSVVGSSGYEYLSLLGTVTYTR